MPEDAAPVEAPDSPDAPEPSGPAQEVGTPAPEPAEGSPAEIDWQKRAEDNQAWATKAAQEASQYRQILDLARKGDPEALAALGLEVEGDEEDDYDPEAEEPLTRAEFEAWQREQDEARSQQEKEAEFYELQDQFVDQELNKLAKDSSDRYKRTLTALAFELSDDEGIPDFEAAHKELQEEFEEQRGAYLKSKKAEKVEVGTAGTEKVNLADDDSRVGLLADMIEAGEQDS